MAEIIPFRGIRYSAAGPGGLSPLLAPPYDVISPQYQEELYGRHEHNVVRIDFGKALPGDDGENRYTRARGFLDAWTGSGVLKRDERPCIYLYRMEYDVPGGGGRQALTGIVCMLKVEEWDSRVVLPHEKTLKGPKADRMELMKATGVSASQIFSLYSDPGMRITAAMLVATKGCAPDAQAADDDGAAHMLWAVSDPSAIKAARDALAGAPVFIADGHHRYETAIAFRDLQRARGPYTGSEMFNYVPMFLANMEEEGLTVLPTHRLVVERAGVTSASLIERAAEYFEVEEFPFTASDGKAALSMLLARLAEKGRVAPSFGCFFHGDPAYRLLTIKDISHVRGALGCERSEAYCSLDVTILQSLVIERIIGITTDEIAASQPVKFEKDAARAAARVQAGEFMACFLMNPTKVREVRDVASAGEVMPQKSTYFYPKLLTGLVIAPITR